MAVHTISLEVPDDCVVSSAITVVEIIADDGRLMSTTYTENDMLLSSALGLLELGKRDLLEGTRSAD